MEDTIKGALPYLEYESLNMILLHLTTMGVRTAEDMGFINAIDLRDLLPPVHCRKLIHAFRKGTLYSLMYLS